MPGWTGPPLQRCAGSPGIVVVRVALAFFAPVIGQKGSEDSGVGVLEGLPLDGDKGNYIRSR